MKQWMTEQVIWKLAPLDLKNTSRTSRIHQMTKDEVFRRRTKSINGTRNFKIIFTFTSETDIWTVRREKRGNLQSKH
jgi:hypothetical protein